MEGQTLFNAEEEGMEYSARKHLQEMMNYLGWVPKDLIERGEHSERYFAAEDMSNSFIITDLLQLTMMPQEDLKIPMFPMLLVGHWRIPSQR